MSGPYFQATVTTMTAQRCYENSWDQYHFVGYFQIKRRKNIFLSNHSLVY